MTCHDTITVDAFRASLDRIGASVAPNGASYRITWHRHWSNDGPAVERTKNGNREIVVGFNGIPFSSLQTARTWAVADGRHEYNPGFALDQRQRIA